MKLSSKVYDVKASGRRLRVKLKAETIPDELPYSTVTHEIEMPDSKMARDTYFLGRKVLITVYPETIRSGK